MKKKIGIYVLIWLLIFIMCSACVHNDAFTAKIHAMSDTELIECYRGINERIKDIEHDQTMSRRSDDTEQDRILSQSTFFGGGEGQDLVEKQRIISREIKRRNLPQ